MRQHVNPLSNVFYDIEPLPPLEEIFNDYNKPLHLDIGCGPGNFLMKLALHNKNWNFSRSDAHELVADIYTNMCQYRLYFNWSESLKSINFTVTFDIKFPPNKHSDIYELLAKINEKLWIGHFDITSKSGILAYRQTFFLPHENDMLFNQLEDLVDISIYEYTR